MSDNNNTFNRLYTNLVHERHNELRAAGKNPNLTDVRNEILRVDALRLTEDEVATYLTAPVIAGRRGTTKKGASAATASRRAAQASELAEGDEDNELHTDALLAHAEARKLHLQAADYHDGLVQYHRGKSRALSGSRAENFAPARYHCSSCNEDFDAEDGKLDDKIIIPARSAART